MYEVGVVSVVQRPSQLVGFAVRGGEIVDHPTRTLLHARVPDAAHERVRARLIQFRFAHHEFGQFDDRVFGFHGSQQNAAKTGTHPGHPHMVEPRP